MKSAPCRKAGRFFIDEIPPGPDNIKSVFILQVKGFALKTGLFPAIVAVFFCLALAFAPRGVAAQDIPSLNTNTFDPTLDKEQRPVLIQFHAVWCVYCKAMEPDLEKLRNEKLGRIDFYRVDADRSPELVSAYKVNTLPTLMIFYKGKLLSRANGAVHKGQLEKWVDGVEQEIRKLPPDFGDAVHNPRKTGTHL